MAALSDLRDHSLVQIIRDEIRTRYKLLDTVRDYLSRLVAEGGIQRDLDDCRRRHAEHFAGLAVEIGKLMAEGRWSAGTAALMQDIGNLRIAIDTAANLNRYDLIAAFAGSIARRFFEAGLLADFRKLADAAYVAAEALGKPDLRIQLLGLDGALASRQGDEALCEQLWLERVDLCRASDDVEQCADTLVDLAYQAFEHGDSYKSRLRLVEALRLARSINDPAFIATARVVQARLAFASSNPRLAAHRSRQAEKLLPECADRSGAMFVYQNLIILSRESGNIPKSLGLTLELLHSSIERHQVVHAGWALLELAPLYEQTQQLAMSARCYLGAMKIHAEYSTRQRTRANTAFSHFKKRHEEEEVTTTLSSLRGKSWLEVAEGLA